MFCSNCGQRIPEGLNKCPNCGKEMGNFTQKITNAAGEVIYETEVQLGSAINDVTDTFQQRSFNGYGRRLKSDRGIIGWFLLSVITCGIYNWFFIHSLAKDINDACDGDGEKTSGLAMFILLSVITCGLYVWIWHYKLGNRLAKNAPRYGMSFQENGTTVLLWMLFGIILCGIGPLIATNIIIKNSNAICSAYNRQHGYAV
jgi:hypothetical protein